MFNNSSRNLFSNHVFNCFLLVCITFSLFYKIFLTDGHPSWADNPSTRSSQLWKGINNESNFTYAEYANGLVYHSNTFFPVFLLIRFLLF